MARVYRQEEVEGTLEGLLVESEATMTHQSPQDDTEFLISQYMDDQLDDRQKAEFLRRLESDPALAEELRKYQALDAHLAALSSDALGEVDFDLQRSSIMAGLERKVLLEGSHRRLLVLRPVFWAPLAAAAMIALAVVVGLKFVAVGPAVDPNASQVSSNVVLPTTDNGKGVVEVAAVATDPSSLPPLPAKLSPNNLPAGTIVMFIDTDEKDSADDNGSAEMAFF